MIIFVFFKQKDHAQKKTYHRYAWKQKQGLLLEQCLYLTPMQDKRLFWNAQEKALRELIYALVLVIIRWQESAAPRKEQ